MIMRIATLILLQCLLCSALSAQVRIDRPIVLEGTQDAERQVTGLRPSTDATDLITADVERSGVHRTSTGVSGVEWSLTLPGILQDPVAGTHIVVRGPAPASGPVSVVLNGSDPIAVQIGPAQVLLAEEVPEGAMLSLVHDGQAFQVLNGSAHFRRPCPPDMVAINPLTCIEPLERPAQDFYEASLLCGGLDRRMCTWGEIHIACQMRDSLGLQNMIGNWEWTVSGADHDFNLRVVGQSDCFVSTRLHGGNISSPYRCCYSR